MIAPPPMTIPYFLGVNARMHGQRTAVVYEDSRLTWRELDEAVNRFANMLLARGLEKGGKVVLVMETSLDMIAAIFGTVRAGGVLTTLNPGLPVDALVYMINKLKGAQLFADAEFMPLVDGLRADLTGVAPRGYLAFGDAGEGWEDVRPLIAAASPDTPEVDVATTDTMDITFTSGTTGRPKGIELSHQSRLNYGMGVGNALHMDRHSVTICTAPLHSNGCWVLMIPALQHAGTVVLMKAFEPQRFLELVNREQCTHLYLLPFQANAVTECVGEAPSALRILSGGAMLPDKTAARLAEIFPNVEVHLLYGQSEGFTTIAGPKDFARGKNGSMGFAVFGADLRLIDADDNDLGIGAEGEIIFYGPGMMKGYFEEPEKTAKLFWMGPNGRTYFRTGDFGRIDEDGYLYFLGRAQDVIRYRGQSLFASQMERLLSQHPAVKEVCVCGIKDAADGETPVAFVIADPDASLDAVTLKAWALGQAHGGAVPAEIVLRTEFPRGTLDKVLKNELAASYVPDRVMG